METYICLHSLPWNHFCVAADVGWYRHCSSNQRPPSAFACWPPWRPHWFCATTKYTYTKIQEMFLCTSASANALKSFFILFSIKLATSAIVVPIDSRRFISDTASLHHFWYSDWFKCLLHMFNKISQCTADNVDPAGSFSLSTLYFRFLMQMLLPNVKVRRSIIKIWISDKIN